MASNHAIDQQVPKPIQPTIRHYISLINQHASDLIKAFYLEGSIALGGFNEHFSDIDFIIILNRPITSTDIECLRNVHKAVEKNQPRWKMSGSYLQSSVLKYPHGSVESILYFHDEVLRSGGYFELNSFEGWILKNHGITIIGMDAHNLPFTIDWNLLVEKMGENLNSYWANWTRHPKRIITLLSDWGIQWAVLGVLRQFYSFRENAITTKTKAGEYALTCLPGRWHQLIQEAIDIREGIGTSVYQYKVVRTVEAIKFLNFIIQTCNANFT